MTLKFLLENVEISGYCIIQKWNNETEDHDRFFNGEIENIKSVPAELLDKTVGYMYPSSDYIHGDVLINCIVIELK